MKVAAADSPRIWVVPRSMSRNNDQGPSTGNTEGCAWRWSWTMSAVRGAAPGHWMVTTEGGGVDGVGGGGGGAGRPNGEGGGGGAGGAAAVGLNTCVPPLSNFTVTPGVGMLG